MEDTQSMEVVIAGSTYSLQELPASSSAIVQEGRARLLGALDLEALVDDLGRLGNFIRIAYHGVAGYTKLQIKIQRIGYDVTKLCDKSAITVGKFKNASSTILHTLQGTYQYLLDGLEDMALETLSDMSETAKEMADAANQLHKDFEQQSEVVVTTLEETQTQQGMEQKKKKELEEERRKMETNKKEQEAAHQEACRLEAQAEMYMEKAEKKEDKAIAEQSSVLKNIANGFTGMVGFKAFDMDPHKDAAKAAREEKMVYYKKMNEQQEKRREALMKLAQYTITIQQTKDDEAQTENAIHALQCAIGALKSLSAVMMQAATFWLQMKSHCDDLAKADVKKQIETVLRLPEERRMKVWTSIAFKVKAVRYYAKWVALDDVCTIYVDRIKLTQRELYTYIQEALLPKEAHEKARSLASRLQADLEEQQKAIADKQFKHNEAIKALQNEEQ
uniref:Uncharacterized protein n=1 Tax=Amphimedon queenslandica TaxID=400682 RepID=A0A1X7UW90_AMPQE